MEFRTLRRIMSLSILLLLIFTGTALGDQASSKTTSKQIQQFINKMSKKYHFKRSYLTQLMKHATYLKAVIPHVTHPFEKKPWHYYKSFFINQSRINDGAYFWKQHAKTLQKVQKQYGVAPSIIVAIIGIESKYGHRVGRYPELSVLYTLAFRYPPRAKYFRYELKKYLLLTRKYHLSPLKLVGSYAGALGIPQFMPSSYLRYAVAFSKKQPVDLLTNANDAIASIAYYLKEKGWQFNQPVASPAIVKQQVPKRIISKTGRPKMTLSQFAKYGIYPKQTFSKKKKAALIVLTSQNLQEYWVVFKNFRAIMKYNPRTTYAMAVYLLSREIRKRYYEQNPHSTSATINQ